MQGADAEVYGRVGGGELVGVQEPEDGAQRGGGVGVVVASQLARRRAGGMSVRLLRPAAARRVTIGRA
ncbi:hypothetical protein GCM10010510_71890 [Streptomyces anandii JCM 4720]|nr:hypothetical protein GCM10010510_71890 [Streptomyces anandii JCM 4720]